MTWQCEPEAGKVQVQGAPTGSRASLCLRCVALAHCGLLRHLRNLSLYKEGKWSTTLGTLLVKYSNTCACGNCHACSRNLYSHLKNANPVRHLCCIIVDVDG